jgi:hypothetical protein
MGKHAADLPAVEPPQVTTLRVLPYMPDVRARHQTAAMAGEHAHHAGGFDKGTAAALTRSWQDVSTLHDYARVLAVDVLAMAQAGGMPDSYWHTDRRIERALNALDLTADEAQQIDWAELPTSR